MTINDANRYLLLELPDTYLPPAIEEICFHLQSRNITPIITHPERHMIMQETPDKLKRLVDLGCLVQMTGNSLTGWFGRRVKKISRQLVKLGYVHLLATDAHDPDERPPLLREAVTELSRLVGKNRAQAMINDIPEKSSPVNLAFRTTGLALFLPLRPRPLLNFFIQSVQAPKNCPISSRLAIIKLRP
jgi:protein-tyrosine phosphatase